MNEMFKAYIGEMFGPPGLAVDVVRSGIGER